MYGPFLDMARYDRIILQNLDEHYIIFCRTQYSGVHALMLKEHDRVGLGVVDIKIASAEPV